MFIYGLLIKSQTFLNDFFYFFSYFVLTQSKQKSRTANASARSFKTYETLAKWCIKQDILNILKNISTCLFYTNASDFAVFQKCFAIHANSGPQCRSGQRFSTQNQLQHIHSAYIFSIFIILSAYYPLIICQLS
jgi:hypothetical protein